MILELFFNIKSWVTLYCVAEVCGLKQKNRVPDYREVVVSRKKSFFKGFLYTRKRKAGDFKFLRFRRMFPPKASFSGRISVDGRPNERTKAPFANWTEPKLQLT